MNCHTFLNKELVNDILSTGKTKEMAFLRFFFFSLKTMLYCHYELFAIASFVLNENFAFRRIIIERKKGKQEMELD